MPAWFLGIAKVLYVFVEVNLSDSFSLIVPTDARYLQRRPEIYK